MRAFLASPLLLLAACQTPDLPPAAAAPPTEATPAELRVGDAYTFAAPMGGTAGLFLTIDAGTEPDTLLAIRTDAALRTEVHETTDAGDGMRGMRPVEALPVPSSGVRLEPGSVHAMLFETTRALAPGDTLGATAVFSRAGDVPVRAVVRALRDAQ